MKRIRFSTKMNRLLHLVNLKCLLLLLSLGLFSFSTSAQSLAKGQLIEFDSNWNMKIPVEHNNWYNGWDKIISIDIDGNGMNEILCFSKNSSLADRNKALIDIYSTPSSTRNSLIKRHTNIYKNWDEIIPIDIDGDGKDELLCYAKNSSLTEDGLALADIYSVDRSGDFKLIKRHKNWYSKWEKIIVTDIDSDSSDELLFYSKNISLADEGKSLGDFMDINASGDIKLIKRHSNWYKLWDQIVPLDVDKDGKDELLFYSKGSQNSNFPTLGDIYDIKPNGDVSLLKRHENWYAAWDKIVSGVSLGGDRAHELFFYSKSGLASVDAISSAGSISSKKIFKNFVPNVTHIVAHESGAPEIENLILYTVNGGMYSGLERFGYNGGDGWNRTAPDELNRSAYASYIKLNFSSGTAGTLDNNFTNDQADIIADYFNEVSEGRFKLKSTAIYGPIDLDKDCSDFPDPIGQTFRTFAVEEAVRNGLNLRRYDASRDGEVTDRELGIMVFANCPSGQCNCIPIERQGEADGSGISYKGGIATGGTQTNLISIIHEFAHVYFDAFDLYTDGTDRQCNCAGATLMEATANTNFNSPLIHLDPFHRIVLGWLKPRAYDVNNFPRAAVNIRYTTGAKPLQETEAPIILFDSKRGYKEYFILEYRNNQLAKYDGGAADTGVAVWHVKREGAHFKDTEIKLIRPTDNSVFWDDTNSTIDLNWSNGDQLPFTLDFARPIIPAQTRLVKLVSKFR